MTTEAIDLGEWTLRRASVGTPDFYRINNLLEYYACSDLAVGFDRQIDRSNECRLKWSTTVHDGGARIHSAFNKDPNLWRFNIVSPHKDTFDISGQIISRALRISKPGLKIDAWSILDNDGNIKFGGMPERCIAELQLNTMRPAASLKEADFQDVPSIAQSIFDMRLNPELSFIETAISRFETFDSSREGILKTIGYFAIQELLAAPGQGQISRRFRENLASRFANDGYNEDYFRRLYDLRCQIAHGDESMERSINAFASTELNADNSDPFFRWRFLPREMSIEVRKLTKMILRDAVEHPQPYADFRR